MASEVTPSLPQITAPTSLFQPDIGQKLPYAQVRAVGRRICLAQELVLGRTRVLAQPGYRPPAVGHGYPMRTHRGVLEFGRVSRRDATEGAWFGEKLYRLSCRPITPRRPGADKNSMPAASRTATTAATLSGSTLPPSRSIVPMVRTAIPACLANCSCDQFSNARAARICRGSTISSVHRSFPAKERASTG